MNPNSECFDIDDHILSEAFLERHCLKYTSTPYHPVTNVPDSSSFNEKYLAVSTPDTPKQNSINNSPFSSIQQKLQTARKSIQESRQDIRKVLFNSPPRHTTQSIASQATKRNFDMEKLGSCRKFAGYPKENGSKFLREFESFCQLHDIDSDIRKQLASFHLHLEGPALSWFNGLSPDLTWRTIKRLFSEKYVTIGWEHPSVVVESETFHNMQLAPSQEIEDFFCQVHEKGQLLSKPDHEIMFRFIHGLPDKLAFYVRSSQPKTMYDAYFAKQGEAYKYRIHEQCAAIGKRADVSRRGDISEMKSQIYDLTQMMHNMSSRQGCQPAKFDNTLCFNCNAPGHVKSLVTGTGLATLYLIFHVSCANKTDMVQHNAQDINPSI